MGQADTKGITTVGEEQARFPKRPERCEALLNKGEILRREDMRSKAKILEVKGEGKKRTYQVAVARMGAALRKE